MNFALKGGLIVKILNSTFTYLGLLIIGLFLVFLPVSYAQDLKLAADVNADGVVNILDLTLVAKDFGETIAADQSAPNPDVDRDGTVDIRDLTLVAKYFGQTVEHPTPPTQFDGPIEVTDATFQSLVLDAELPVVVEFWAEWCPFCRQMKPVVEAVASEHSETFTIARLDIEANRQTTGTYGIQGIPTYLVFRDGEVVGRLVGAMPKASFVSGILGLLK